MPIKVKVIHEGPNNVYIVASGVVEKGDAVIRLTELKKMTEHPTSLRIDTIYFATEPGLVARLAWEQGDMISPLDGKGKLEFSWAGGLPCPEGNSITGDIIFTTKCESTKAFMVGLDLTKRK